MKTYMDRLIPVSFIDNVQLAIRRIKIPVGDARVSYNEAQRMHKIHVLLCNCNSIMISTSTSLLHVDEIVRL